MDNLLKEAFAEYKENIKSIFKEAELISLPSPKTIKYHAPIHEMATITSKKDGFPFVVTINSDDHEPPHMHFFSTDKQFLFRLEITKNIPSSIKDFVFIDEVNLNNKDLKLLLAWANSKNKNGTIYWKLAIDFWDGLHPND